MLIGIDASRANRQKKTGTEWYSFYLIKSLALVDKKNRYCLYLNTPPSSEIKDIILSNKNFSYKVLKWPFSSFWTLGRLSLEMIFNTPDVLFVPAHGIPLIHPKKTVNTIHDIAFVRDSEVYRQESPKASTKSRRQIIKILVKIFTLGRHNGNSLDYLKWSTLFSLKHSSSIITVSNYTKQEILNYYPRVKEKKIKVVYNGYCSEIFQPINDNQKIKSVLGKYDIDEPFFLYIGRLEKKKNTPYLIEAMSILKSEHPELEEKLLLIGNASYGFDEVKYVIEEFDLESEVIMPGWIDEADIPYIFNAASAFIFPSRHEGFGIPVVQALACKIPCAISDLPVLHEVADEAALYFDCNSKKDIAQAMYKIIIDKNLRQDLISKGLQRSKYFSFNLCAQETLKILESSGK